MRIIDIHGMTNMELVRGETDEWYWATDYIHGDLYEAEELFRQGHSVKSNRLYLIHYPDGTVYEPVPPVDGQYLGYPVYDDGTVVLLVVNFAKSKIHILRFLHQQEETQEVVQLPLSTVKDCYNLMLHTSPLSLPRLAAGSVCIAANVGCRPSFVVVAFAVTLTLRVSSTISAVMSFFDTTGFSPIS